MWVWGGSGICFLPFNQFHNWMSLKLISYLSNSEERPAQSCTQHLLIIYVLSVIVLCVPEEYPHKSGGSGAEHLFPDTAMLVFGQIVLFFPLNTTISSSKSLSWGFLLKSGGFQVANAGCWRPEFVGWNPSLAVLFGTVALVSLEESGSWKNTSQSPPKVWVWSSFENVFTVWLGKWLKFSVPQCHLLYSNDSSGWYNVSLVRWHKLMSGGSKGSVCTTFHP